MNKELIKKVNKAVSDNLDYDFMMERIISICTDEAIDAVKNTGYEIERTIIRTQAISAIEKRMK